MKQQINRERAFLSREKGCMKWKLMVRLIIDFSTAALKARK
jgi:hypothetical protein